jgi:hypothetical protein
MKHSAFCIAASLCAALPAGAAMGDLSDSAPTSALEDIHVLRSVREERGPSQPFCTAERIGFAPGVNADRFSFWSMTVRPADGRITNALVREVGDVWACSGPTSDPRVINFYLEGQVAGIEFRSIGGDCRLMQINYPEPGLFTYRCVLELGGLPVPYVGGLLTSNTIFSAGAVIGTETVPAGYLQSSIATIRLWRAR